MRITKKHVFFWGDWPSNWQKCSFVDEDGNKFNTSEQYFMYRKAKFFGDEETAALILTKGKNPKVAKELGRKVKNYNDDEWSKVRYQVMVEANLLKYRQDEAMKKEILNPMYDGLRFCEGSPIDSVWGIKCSYTIAKDDESNWNGLNLLGKCLDEVREIIKKEEANG